MSSLFDYLKMGFVYNFSKMTSFSVGDYENVAFFTQLNENKYKLTCMPFSNPLKMLEIEVLIKFVTKNDLIITINKTDLNTLADSCGIKFSDGSLFIPSVLLDSAINNGKDFSNPTEKTFNIKLSYKRIDEFPLWTIIFRFIEGSMGEALDIRYKMLFSDGELAITQYLQIVKTTIDNYIGMQPDIIPYAANEINPKNPLLEYETYLKQQYLENE